MGYKLGKTTIEFGIKYRVKYFTEPKLWLSKPWLKNAFKFQEMINIGVSFTSNKV